MVRRRDAEVLGEVAGGHVGPVLEQEHRARRGARSCSAIGRSGASWVGGRAGGAARADGAVAGVVRWRRRYDTGVTRFGVNASGVPALRPARGRLASGPVAVPPEAGPRPTPPAALPGASRRAACGGTPPRDRAFYQPPGRPRAPSSHRTPHALSPLARAGGASRSRLPASPPKPTFGLKGGLNTSFFSGDDADSLRQRRERRLGAASGSAPSSPHVLPVNPGFALRRRGAVLPEGRASTSNPADEAFDET